MESIKEEKYVEANSGKGEQRYWALKKQAYEFGTQFVAIQKNNNSTEHTVKEQDAEILKFKQEIQIVVHLKNEAIFAKEQNQFTSNHFIYILQHDAQHVKVVVNQLTKISFQALA